MDKKILDFLEKNRIQRKYEGIKFIEKQDELDFKESLKIFERALRIGNPQKREKTIKEAIQKSKYNVEARLTLISEKLSLREQRIELDRLEIETLDYPIVKDEKELAIDNPFYSIVIEYKVYFYLENKLYIYHNPYRRSLVELEDGAITKLTIAVVDSIKIELLKDDYYEFSILLDKLSAEVKETEYILFSELLFAIKNENVDKALNCMEKLKYKNSDIEVIFDFMFGNENKKNVNKKTPSFIAASFAVSELAEIIENSHYVQVTLMWLNEEVRSDDPYLERSIKVLNTTLEDMKKDPIFKGVAVAVLNILYEEGIVDAESFTDYTKKDFTYIDGIGKITIKRLEENGVIFKEE